MDFKRIITAFLAGKFGKKYAGRIGKKFGLTGEQVMMIAMVGIPLVMKVLASRKAKKGKGIIQGKIR